MCDGLKFNFPFCHWALERTKCVEHAPCNGNKVRESYFWHKGCTQGHRSHLKGIVSGVYMQDALSGVRMQNMKSLHYGSKVIVKEV